MKQKFSLRLIFFFGLFCIYSLLCFAQEDMKFIKSPAFKTYQRPPAVFVHDKHNEKAGLYDCSICHHVYENGKLVEGAMSVGQSCSDCHKVKKSVADMTPLMEAYHKQCITCHKKRKKGPLACGECHVKK